MSLFNTFGDVVFNLNDNGRYIHKAGSSWTHVRKYRKDLKEEWDRRFDYAHIDSKDLCRLAAFWGEALEQAIDEENKTAERYFRSKAEKYHFAEFATMRAPKQEFWEDYRGFDINGTVFKFSARHGDSDFFEKDKLYKHYVKFGSSYKFNQKTKKLQYAFLGKWSTKNSFNHFVYIWFWKTLVYTWFYRVVLTLSFQIVAWSFFLPLLFIFNRKYFYEIIRKGYGGIKKIFRILVGKE